MSELLAPAGSMESLKAAIANGCDAVRLGEGGELLRGKVYPQHLCVGFHLVVDISSLTTKLEPASLSESGSFV